MIYFRETSIKCIPASNSVYFVLFLSWDFWQDRGNLAIDCIHSSISAKYLKLNLSLINPQQIDISAILKFCHNGPRWDFNYPFSLQNIP